MTMATISAGIIGGAGYTGGETLRLLLNHPNTEIAFIQSRSQAGKPVTSIHQDLIGETDLIFSADAGQADVIFLCLGHGESAKYLQEYPLPAGTRVIDLSQDFRLSASAAGFTYGLPELNREAIKTAYKIANPGCFATAIQLGLLPLAAWGMLGEVHTTGITGSTGAGQKLQDTTHFTWRANNISPYKTLNHQHLAEIRQSLNQLHHGYNQPLNFIPWRGDFTRGIFVTSVTSCDRPLDEITARYKEFYASHPFTRVIDHDPDLKSVVNTNKCIIRLEQSGTTLAIHSAIDNLLKGACGQAVQNMNLMFGFSEEAGLRLKGSIF